ncbi:MAG: tRNA pseudouridine(55) synthase TruB [Parafilimonas sp.]
MKQKIVHPAFQPFAEGKLLLVDKPINWTSFDVVKKIRILTGVSKVGHAGTLDPLATGLLIICTGKATKKIKEFMGMEKEYTGSLVLGATTPTYDLESKPDNFYDVSHITQEAIQNATHLFKGNILQIPPMHSAIKKEGKPLYLLARKGKIIELEPRPVTITQFNITEISLPHIYFRVVCSAGTYIRSLANDFGKVLGVGAYLSNLCRIRIGEFKLEQAQTIEMFEDEIRSLKQNSERQTDT